MQVPEHIRRERDERDPVVAFRCVAFESGYWDAYDGRPRALGQTADYRRGYDSGLAARCRLIALESV